MSHPSSLPAAKMMIERCNQPYTRMSDFAAAEGFTWIPEPGSREFERWCLLSLVDTTNKHHMTGDCSGKRVNSRNALYCHPDYPLGREHEPEAFQYIPHRLRCKHCERRFVELWSSGMVVLAPDEQ